MHLHSQFSTLDPECHVCNRSVEVLARGESRSLVLRVKAWKTVVYQTPEIELTEDRHEFDLYELLLAGGADFIVYPWVFEVVANVSGQIHRNNHALLKTVNILRGLV